MLKQAPRIGLVDAVHGSCRSYLEAAGFEVVDLHHLSESQAREGIRHVNGIVVRSRFPFDRDFMAANQHLKCIGRWGSGLENIDLEAAAEYSIAVVNAPEGNRQAVGEHALLLLLCLLRHMPRIDQDVRRGKWEREQNRGTELFGKTVGIIGYGNTGSAFARVLSGFRVRVLAHDKYRRGFSDGYIQEAPLEAVLEQADVLSLHLPQTAETKNYIHEERLKALGKPVYLINTARGNLIEPHALVNGLNRGQIIGAGLDVLPFESSSFEHLDHNPLLAEIQQHPKIVFSPHIAGWTHEANVKMAEWLVGRMCRIYNPV
jgi:D-3-phosphoglycerate dehydrogenase